MRPRLTTEVYLVNPGPDTASAVTGNTVAGAATRTRELAYISQRPVENLSSAIELRGAQATTISLWTILVRPGAPLNSTTTVETTDGMRFTVEGDPSTRTERGRPIYRAAAMRRISDLEG